MDPEIYKIAATLTPKERLKFLNSEMEFDRWANGPSGEDADLELKGLEASQKPDAPQNGRPSKIPWAAIIVGGFALLTLGWVSWIVASNFDFSLTLQHF